MEFEYEIDRLLYEHTISKDNQNHSISNDVINNFKLNEEIDILDVLSVLNEADDKTTSSNKTTTTSSNKTTKNKPTQKNDSSDNEEDMDPDELLDKSNTDETAPKDPDGVDSMHDDVEKGSVAVTDPDEEDGGDDSETDGEPTANDNNEMDPSSTPPTQNKAYKETVFNKFNETIENGNSLLESLDSILKVVSISDNDKTIVAQYVTISAIRQEVVNILDNAKMVLHSYLDYPTDKILQITVNMDARLKTCVKIMNNSIITIKKKNDKGTKK